MQQRGQPEFLPEFAARREKRTHPFDIAGHERPGARMDIAREIAALLMPGPSGLAKRAHGRQGHDTASPDMFWQEIRAVYQARRFLPAFIVNGRPGPHALAIAGRISQAARDGLDPAPYQLAALRPARTPQMAARHAAAFEVDLARAILRYVHDVQGGTIDPHSISKLIGHTPERPDPRRALRAVMAASDPLTTLRGFHPPHAAYWQLHRELARLHKTAIRRIPQITLPPGGVLRAGMKTGEVVRLRWRLNLPAAPGERADHFDAALTAAVVDFQKSAGLVPDGVIGPKTAAQLNLDPTARQIARIAANMERWRWVPRDLGRMHILVNVPEFKAKIMTDRQEILQSRVIVGRVHSKTPLFSGQMSHLIVNPYWHVPPSIARRELLPEIRRNPVQFLSENAYEILENGKVLDPAGIDWDGLDWRSARLRQQPGAKNALGAIKFIFPNPWWVYIHDTPAKPLFAESLRAFSHGCVRLEHPFHFADALLGQLGEWSQGRAAGLIGTREKRIELADQVPVHIVYFTARVENGSLEFAPDLYEYDSRIIAGLNLPASRPAADAQRHALLR